MSLRDRVVLGALNRARRSNALTRAVWGVPVHRKQMPLNWDMTTLVLKQAIDRFGPGAGTYLDMGCGGLALLGQYAKTRCPGLAVTSVDCYPEFVDNARYNIGRNGLDVGVAQGDLFDGLAGRFDLVSFNPPYVPADPTVDMAFPRTRFGGPDGTDVARRFLDGAAARLSRRGVVLLGINCFYVPQARCEALIEDAGWRLVDVLSMRFNTARVFVVRPSEGAA